MIITPHEVWCDGCRKPVPKAPGVPLAEPSHPYTGAIAHVRLNITSHLELKGSPCSGQHYWTYQSDRERNLERLLDEIGAWSP